MKKTPRGGGVNTEQLLLCLSNKNILVDTDFFCKTVFFQVTAQTLRADLNGSNSTIFRPHLYSYKVRLPCVQCMVV